LAELSPGRFDLGERSGKPRRSVDTEEPSIEVHVHTALGAMETDGPSDWPDPACKKYAGGDALPAEQHPKFGARRRWRFPEPRGPHLRPLVRHQVSDLVNRVRDVVLEKAPG